MAMTADVPPIPPELAASDDDTAWVDDLVEEATVFAAERACTLEVALDVLTSRLDADAPARAWRVDGLGTAEWAMRHVAAADVELAELRTAATAWEERITQWFDQRARGLQARRLFFARHLERYALDAREANPKAKTVTVPSGKVSTTGRGPVAAVEDEPAVVLWASERFDLDEFTEVVQTTQRVLLPGLRSRVAVVEVVDFAKITLTDGTILNWAREDDAPLPGVLDVIDLGDGEEAQVAKVETIDSHLAVVDTVGAPVPGTFVVEGRVTAKVTPA